jgi:hypothetical protein
VPSGISVWMVNLSPKDPFDSEKVVRGDVYRRAVSFTRSNKFWSSFPSILKDNVTGTCITFPFDADMRSSV